MHTNEVNIEYMIIDMDFASLYPNSMKDWTKDTKFMAELKRIQIKRLKEERIKKLDKINKSNEKNY